MAFYAEVDVDIYRKPKAKAKDPEKELIKAREKREKQIKKISAKAIGLTLATANYVNAKVGQYTGNKLRQSNISTTLTLAGIGVGAFFDPLGAAIAATALTVKSVVDHEIRLKNAQQESNFKMSYRGNMTTSGSRWKGSR